MVWLRCWTAKARFTRCGSTSLGWRTGLIRKIFYAQITVSTLLLVIDRLPYGFRACGPCMYGRYLLRVSCRVSWGEADTGYEKLNWPEATQSCIVEAIENNLLSEGEYMENPLKKNCNWKKFVYCLLCVIMVNFSLSTCCACLEENQWVCLKVLWKSLSRNTPFSPCLVCQQKNLILVTYEALFRQELFELISNFIKRLSRCRLIYSQCLRCHVGATDVRKMTES